MPEPGIYFNMSNDEYHSNIDFLSKGNADLLGKAPALYLQKIKEGDKKTKALFQGRAIHTFCLEPHKVERIYYRLPKNHNGKTKVGKERVARILENGFIPLSDEEWQQFSDMSDSVNSHKYASALLSGAIIESSVFWTDFLTNCPCKCRPDILHHTYRVLADLKSAIDASEDGFSRAIANFKYYTQAAHYLDGVQTLFPEITRFLFIAVEKTPPYLVAVYELDERSITIGRRQITETYRTFMDCKQSGIYPGYEETINVISLPRWVK
jgi:exodeoxyribonuclease VIII